MNKRDRSYRVVEKNTKEDITDKHKWYLRPDGKLFLFFNGNLIQYTEAEVYEIQSELLSDESIVRDKERINYE